MRRSRSIASLTSVALAIALLVLPGTSSAASRSGVIVVTGSILYETHYLDVVRADSPLDSVVRQLSADAYGTWTASVPAGRYKVVADDFSWFGGATFATGRTVTVTAGKTTRARIDLRRAGLLQGQVQDAAGNPLPLVRAVVSRAGRPAEVLGSTALRDDGAFYLLGPFDDRPTTTFIDLTGRYESRSIRFNDLVGQWRSITLRKKVGPQPVYDPDAGGGTLSGHVTVDDPDEAAQRVSPAVYEAESFTRPIDVTDVYDPDRPGDNVHFDLLREGRYKVQLTPGLWVGGSSFETAKVFTIGRGTASRFDAHVPPRRTIRGRVVTALGNPLDGVLVSVYREGGATPIARVVTGPTNTGNGGSFTFAGLVAGSYQVKLTDAHNRTVPRWIGGTYDRSSAVSISPARNQDRDVGDKSVGTGIYALTTPTITGTPRVGRKLTAHGARWAIGGLKIRPQWLRDGKPISRATGWTRTLTKADRGHLMSVRLDAYRSGRPHGSVVSRPTNRKIV